VVVDRPGNAVRPPDDIDWIHVEVPRLEVSSTDLRARFSDGRPLDYLLTDAVLAVIAARNLYGAVGAATQ
jgi:nicotinate-nucleotide adenylyltransferase